jgi:hypothetical protein
MHQLDLYEESPAGCHLVIHFSIRAAIVHPLGNRGLALTDLHSGSLALGCCSFYRNGGLHATVACKLLIAKPNSKPNRICLAQDEEGTAPHQNPTTDQVNRQIKLTTTFMHDHPRAKGQLTSVPRTGQPSHLAVFFCHASTRTAATITDSSRRRTENQHCYDLSFLLARNTYKTW